jgi:hypothetical protein
LDPRRVFIRKVEDLRLRVDSARLQTALDPDYEVLMASPLLRELLMGEPPLCHLINRHYRLKIRFEVARKPAYERLVLQDRPIFYARGDGLFPGTATPGSETATLNLEKFLREMVMLVQGEPVSVRDLIDYVANAAGAVHFGDPTKGKRALLIELDKGLGIGGMEATPKTLIAVGHIVVAGLQPLVEKAEESERSAA